MAKVSTAALRRKRSQAAKRGWENRRRKARTASRLKRSRAAKLGWERRRIRVQLAELEREAAEREDAPAEPYADEDLEAYAALYGVDTADVEALFDVVDRGTWADPTDPDWDYGRLIDYLEDLAEVGNIDIDDLWDLWYHIMYGEERT